jgi:hypothetical protein
MSRLLSMVKTVWTPVVNPLPRYESNAERIRWEEAQARNPRKPGEDLVHWVCRVIAAAQPVGDRELPPGDRMPGSDDE